MDVSMEAQAQHQGNTFSFFRTGDAESACADWMKMAYNKGGSCHKVSDESVNGRSTVKMRDNERERRNEQFLARS